MRFFDGFANTHTFFVHAPVVLIPTAAAMVWLGRRIRTDSFELATYVITVAAAAAAVMATLTGLQARATVSRDALPADLMQEHLTNGVAVILWAKLIPN